MSDKRRVVKYCNLVVDSCNTEEATITLYGETKSGRQISLQGNLQFGNVPFLLHKLREGWRKARQNRLSEIERIDQSFKEGP